MEYIKQRNGLGVFLYNLIMIIHGILATYWIALMSSVLIGWITIDTSGFKGNIFAFLITKSILFSLNILTAHLCRMVTKPSALQQTNWLTAASILASGVLLTFVNTHYIVLNLLALFFAAPLIVPMNADALMILRPYNLLKTDARAYALNLKMMSLYPVESPIKSMRYDGNLYLPQSRALSKV